MLDGLIALSSMGGEGGGGESEMATMGKQAKRWMPTLFKLLDSDQSGEGISIREGRRGV